MTFFDAHLDLAYLVECGRDMMSPDLATCGGKHPPAAVTFPSLREGMVTACLGTIFTEAVPDPSKPGADTGPYTYPLGDAQAAHRAGLRQLEQYHRWARDGVIRLMPRRGAAEAQPCQPPSHRGSSPLDLGILMECADPIRTPDELLFWANQGVIAIGLAWVHGSRYAAGNGADPSGNPGITDLGRDLIHAMDELGIVHDLSHLSQRATEQLLDLTDAPVIASHSNCRALFDRDPYPNARQRHLADSTITEVARRGGMIGLNLVSAFLDQDVPKDHSASVDSFVRHADHIASLVGHTRCLGLGSDMDGGFSAERLPAGIRRPADLPKLLDALRRGGWSETATLGFAHANWDRFWQP